MILTAVIDINTVINPSIDRFSNTSNNMLNWVKSYFKDRKQYVLLGDIGSKSLDIACGVPQGSMCSPKFFITYINDMCKACDNMKSVSCTDETNIYFLLEIMWRNC